MTNIKESLIERQGKNIESRWHHWETKSNTSNLLPPDFLLYEKNKPYQFKMLFVEYFATSNNWNCSSLIIVPDYSLTLLPMRGLYIFTCRHVTGNAASVWKAKTSCPHCFGLSYVMYFGQFPPTILFFSLCHKTKIVSCHKNAMKMASPSTCIIKKRHMKKRRRSQFLITHV